VAALHRATTRFNIKKFYTLPAEYINVIQTHHTTNSIHILLTRWNVFIYYAVRTATLSAIQALGVSCQPLTIRRSFLPPPSGSKWSLTLKMEGASTIRDLVNSYQLTVVTPRKNRIFKFIIILQWLLRYTEAYAISKRLSSSEKKNVHG